MTPEHALEEGRDHAALYTLGALPVDEAREFEQHVAAGCAVCAAEVQAFSAVVMELGYAAQPQQPSAAVRSRVLERIAAESAATAVIEKEGMRFVRSVRLTWKEATTPTVQIKTLFVDKQRGYRTILIRMAPGATLLPHRHADVEESYVLEGDLLVAGVRMQAGDYCRAEPGSVHTGVTTTGGCVFIAVCSQHDEFFS